MTRPARIRWWIGTGGVGPAAKVAAVAVLSAVLAGCGSSPLHSSGTRTSAGETSPGTSSSATRQAGDRATPARSSMQRPASTTFELEPVVVELRPVALDDGPAVTETNHVFRNPFDEPVRIDRAVVSCGCVATTIDHPRAERERGRRDRARRRR